MRTPTPRVVALAALPVLLATTTATTTATATGAGADAVPATAAIPASAADRAAQQAGPDRPAVVSTRIIGRSVRGYPTRAFELGKRSAPLTVVAIGSMHGNEQDGKVLLNSLRDGAPITGVHLWVVPRQNPDGVLRDRRHNAHAVDLNRNFPRKWKPLTGWYYSGPEPASEPETRATMRFLKNVRPDYVVTFHSPLYGIDTYGAKDRPFARRLAREMNLPRKEFDCGGVCHGTLTQWFNHRFRGACVTVEFGRDPSTARLTGSAARGFLRAIGGHR